MRKVSSSHHSTMGELNITPLLDLAFVLLVIFIITTPQLVNNLEMNLPSGKPPVTNGPKPKVNNIIVKNSGQVTFNDEAATLPELKAMLAKAKAADPEFGVAVRGASDVDYQNVISVLDILQQLDITKVGLATETVNQ